MKLIKELKERGILKDITNEEKLAKLPKGARVYIGFDPTAYSLHLGNYVQISILKRFEKHGIKPIAVIGGATGMIGDPSGRSEERNLLSSNALLENKSAIRKQLESFGIEVIDNYEFYKDMNILEFLRDAGKLLNINYMLSKEVVKSRLEQGISFTEFSYQLLQGWDFKRLYEEHNVMIQVGGSDQWGNITSGIEIIRKTLGDKNLAVGMTTNLLTGSDGKKFGKSTGGGALWLSKDMCSPYRLYQYLLNSSDSDVEKLLQWLTDFSQEEIKTIISEHSVAPFKRKAQKVLASVIIGNIHSKEDFESAVRISESLFGKQSIADLSINEIKQLEGTIPTEKTFSNEIIDFLIESKSVSSKREAREFIKNGAITINGIKIESETSKIPSAFNDEVAIIRRGKKNYFLALRK
ncbi:tyrosine--tRNA ligase [Mycoplasma marinum]|uniref:Tyrosine--tRNA ligase n=2 Tax=Mycoplasma marinum TaxID=1937190 RepID=A0A4R0XP00_9MOLU|nr:tyrosine--tRNA ligase [Mycoplasma marinum]TCG11232.1 tyrosine--tRNA ligase [Mycoplasma marinum]